MSVHLYFLGTAVIVLAFSVMFLWRSTRRSFDEYADTTEKETSLAYSWDPLTFEMSARIFNPDDSDFLIRESSRQIARSFRRQRAAFALLWLLEIRRHVNLLMRAHRRAARSNPDLRPAGELKLGCEFLLFLGTSGILYLVIWLVGPLHAASLVRCSVELAGQLRKMTEAIVSGGTRVAVEVLESESQTKNRTATL